MRRNGFTLIEVLIALLVGVTLTSIAIRSVGAVESRASVRQARSVFASLHARARAQAIETGEMTRLWVDTNQDSVWIMRGAAQLETVRFGEDFGVDIQGGASQLRLCMSPRGFAEVDCNSFKNTQTLTFAARDETASVEIRTLGQLMY